MLAILKPIQDVEVASARPDENQNNNSTMNVGHWTFLKTTNTNRAFLSFDIVGLGALVINSATLHLMQYVTDGAAIDMWTIMPDAMWDETTLTWNTQPGPALMGNVLSLTSGDGFQWKTVDLTAIAEAIRTVGENRGVALVSMDETANGRMVMFERNHTRTYDVLYGITPPEIYLGQPASPGIPGQACARLVVNYDVAS